jgi:putative NADH-flavin reductase
VATLLPFSAVNSSNTEGNNAVTVIEGDVLIGEDVDTVMAGADAILFAVGMSSTSPPQLCARATALILERAGKRRFIWCGGGANRVEGDPDTFG